MKAGTSLSLRGRGGAENRVKRKPAHQKTLRHHQIFLVILRCKVLVSWFFWLFENAGKLARGIFWGLQGLQGVGMVHFWGLHELQVKKKGSFLSFHGVQTSCEGPFSLFHDVKTSCEDPFWSFHGLQTPSEGPFLLFARAANSLRGGFFTLCTGCKPLARGPFSRGAEVATRKVGESQTFLSFYLFKKGWKSWCFSLECGCFICVAYEDVNVATGDVCDV